MELLVSSKDCIGHWAGISPLEGLALAWVLQQRHLKARDLTLAPSPEYWLNGYFYMTLMSLGVA